MWSGKQGLLFDPNEMWQEIAASTANTPPPFAPEPSADDEAANEIIAPADSNVGAPEPDDSEWVAFIRSHGRVPRIDDAKKPWEYRGWLLYYRLLLEDYLDIPKRWEYWFRTMTAGHLLDEPIPAIRFKRASGHEEGSKLLDQWIHVIDRSGKGTWSPMTILLDWLLWGFAGSDEAPRLSNKTQEELYRTVNIGPLILNPYDYFGEWIAEQKGRWNPNAFYPTPHEVVELMTTVNFSGMQETVKRSEKVCDPCMGSGRMLLHASNHSLRLFGVDIDGQVVRATKVNGFLYCPWLVRPFPDQFFPTEDASE